MVGQPWSALNVFTWIVELEIEISAENSDLHLFWQDKKLWGEAALLHTGVKYPETVFTGKWEQLKSKTCPFWSMLLRKWFLCFHPENGCISKAAAAVYHYANVARALIFVYCLYVLEAYCGPFQSGLLFAKRRTLKWTKFFQLFLRFFFLKKRAKFFFWKT